MREQKETDTILVITQIATIVMLEDPLFDVFVVWLDSPFSDVCPDSPLFEVVDVDPSEEDETVN